MARKRRRPAGAGDNSLEAQMAASKEDLDAILELENDRANINASISARRKAIKARHGDLDSNSIARTIADLKLTKEERDHRDRGAALLRAAYGGEFSIDQQGMFDFSKTVVVDDNAGFSITVEEASQRGREAYRNSVPFDQPPKEFDKVLVKEWERAWLEEQKASADDPANDQSPQQAAE